MIFFCLQKILSLHVQIYLLLESLISFYIGLAFSLYLDALFVQLIILASSTRLTGLGSLKIIIFDIKNVKFVAIEKLSP